ncbi:hypothetical protein GCM10022198_01190 [Klugiella xanthotipulae]
MPVGELNAEHRVGQSLNYLALDFDDAVFLGHSLTVAKVLMDAGPAWGLGAKAQTAKEKSYRVSACLST